MVDEKEKREAHDERDDKANQVEEVKLTPEEEAVRPNKQPFEISFRLALQIPKNYVEI